MQNNEIVRTMLDNVVLGIAMINKEMEIIWLNKTLRALFPNIEIQKRPLCYQSFYLPAKKMICDYCPSIKAFRTGKIHSSETDVCNNGKIYNVIAVPVKDEKGKTSCVIETIEDITKRMKADKDIQFYKFAVDNNTLPTYWVKSNAKISYANKAAYQTLGYSYEELLSLRVPEIDPDFPEESWPAHWRDMKEAGTLNFEAHHKTKAGNVFPVEIQSTYLEYNGQEYICAYVHDITERKRSENKLTKYKKLIDNISDLAYICDAKGNILFVNKIFEKLTGHKPEEFFEKPFEPLFDDENFKKARDVYTRTLKGESPTYELYFKDTERLCEYRNFPLRDEEENIVGVMGIARDISERKKRESEVLRAQKLESVGVLAGGIAHDFNNILTAIMGNTNLATILTKAENTDKVLQTLSEIEKATIRAKDLTQQLLTFSRGGAPVKKTVCIAGLIKDSSNFAIMGSNVKCEFSISEGLWQVEVDEGQINQVINNLVINAVQAMPKGGVLKVSAENISKTNEEVPTSLKIEKYIKISIKDHGYGIKNEHITNIFDPYFTTKQNGSGLGLASSYSIIKNHDGFITVESELGVGSTFYIFLPASLKTITKKVEKGDKPIIGNGKILIMDDDDAIRDMGSLALSFIGYEVKSAKDGAEAIEMYKEAKEKDKPFDVVIMDLTIPGGMGGKETIKYLRAISPEAKVIVFSGYSNDPILADCQKYGFNGVICKPFQIKEMQEVLQNVINGKSNKK